MANYGQPRHTAHLSTCFNVNQNKQTKIVKRYKETRQGKRQAFWLGTTMMNINIEQRPKKKIILPSSFRTNLTGQSFSLLFLSKFAKHKKQLLSNCIHLLSLKAIVKSLQQKVDLIIVLLITFRFAIKISFEGSYGHSFQTNFDVHCQN